MQTYFCPGCWRQVDEDSDFCPSCKYNLAEFARLPYEEKLLLSLDHPIRENRAIAIHALGALRSQKALPRFGAMLDREKDYYVLRQVLHALAQVESPGSRAILRRATCHPSRLVRTLALRLLNRPPAAR